MYLPTFEPTDPSLLIFIHPLTMPGFVNRTYKMSSAMAEKTTPPHRIDRARAISGFGEGAID